MRPIFSTSSRSAVVVALAPVLLAFLLVCSRTNPFDAKSVNYIIGKRPHVAFVHDTLSAFLYDTLEIKITCADTTVGGQKGAIKKFYFAWLGDTTQIDSVDGTDADTFVVRKAFPPGAHTTLVTAVDFDGNFSEPDSMKVLIGTSIPQILSASAPGAVAKISVCTLSVSATDFGGTIQAYVWAKDGVNFRDTTVLGIFPISFSDTGTKTILVKVRDNKGIESGADTLRLVVYEKVYRTIYNGNGNTAGSVPIDNINYARGQSVTVLLNTGRLGKTGYAFVGWNTQANGGGANYSAGAAFTMDTFSVTLFAQWTLDPAHTVLYDGNGTSGGTVPLDTGLYTLGQSVTVLGNSGSLVKTGYTFIGWNTLANGSGISYASGVSFIMGSANVTLYAMWTANPTYSVTYNGNGNISGSGPIDANNYTSGATVTVLGNTGSLGRTGYTFVGWNTQANGSGTAYATGVTFPMGSASVTLYAQWTADPTFVVTYGGNGNTGGTAPTDVNSYLTGAMVTTRGAGNLVRVGYSFTGWNTLANGSGTAYAAGATFAMGPENVTLHAQWAINPTYSTTYNGNGSTGGTAPFDSGLYSIGQSVTVLGNSGSLVKTGFTFVGWNTQANGSGISYASGVSFIMGSADVTLYAQWTANPTYSVAYNGNGNTSGSAPIDANNYTAGATVTALGNTGNLARTGYTFVGWNTQAGGGGTAYATGVTFPMGSGSVTLYAQWTANPTFVVMYNGNGSTGGAAPVDANSYLAGAMVTTRGPGNLVRAGYSFTGWNTQANGTGTAYATGATFAMGPASATLYAQWAFNPTFTVTYNGNTNTGGSVPPDTNHYSLGQSVTVLGNSGSLVKTGYTFIGWNTLANGSGISYASGVSFTMGSSNVTLYAKWTSIPTFTVTYVGNGNTGGNVPTDSNNYTASATVTALGNTGNLVRTGYTFVGWNTQAGGSGTGYAAGVTFAMGSASVILYAQWTANPTYIVTYKGNGSTGGVPTDANNYLTGAIVTVLTPGSLVKPGYAFTGWNTQSSGGTSYAVGATFAMGTANVTLYAQWTLISTYTVTYNGNGNTGGNVPVDGKTYRSGDTVTVLDNTSPLGPLVNTGYTFVGWNTQANGGGIGYSAGVKFAVGSAGVTLYAQWTALSTATIIATAGNGKVTVAWTAVSGATSYDLYYAAGITVDKTGTKITGVASPYDVTGLTNGIQYAFAVSVVNAGGESGLSPVQTATPQVPAAGVPTIGSAIPGNNQVTVAWSAVTGATSYNLYWAQGSTVNKNGTKVTGVTLSDVVTGLQNGTLYAFAVSAVNGAGESALSAIQTATPAPPIPNIPVISTAAAGDGMATISWNSVPGATSYVLYYKAGGTVDKTTTTKITPAVSPQTVPSLTNGTQYAFALSAVNTTGESALSQVQTATPQQAVPGVPVISTIAGNKRVIVTWGSVAGASGYNLYYQVGPTVSKASGAKQSLVSSPDTVTGLTNGTQYSFGVSAINPGGESALSAVLTATPQVPSPSPPTLSAPANGASGVSTIPTLSWIAATGATSYELQVSTSSSFASIAFDLSGITTTSQVTTALSNNVLYYWRVNATNAGGTSGWSTPFTFTTIVAAPSPPTLSVPVNGATGVATTPTLSWIAATGATFYELQVSTSSSFASIAFDLSGITTTSQVTTALSNNVLYYWRVNATNAGGTSVWSTPFTFTTIVAAPSPPTLSTPANGASGVATTPTLSWNAVAGAASYEVQVSTSSTFSSTVFDQTGVSTTSQAVTPGLLSNSTPYYWRVNAKNAGGTSAWSTTYSFTTIVAAPTAPSLSTPANSATGVSVSPSLSWNAVGSATTYHLQVSTASDFSTGIIFDSSTLTGNSQAVGPLANSTLYYWRVNATNAGGTSGWSTPFTFTTIVAAPSPPTLSTPANGATGVATTPALSWIAATGATFYELQVSTSSSFASIAFDLSGITTTSQVTTALSNNVLYYWRVNATNAGGTSGWSTPFTFTTIVAAPSPPTLSTPANGADSVSTIPALSWIAATGATSYELQVSTSSLFASIAFDLSGITTTSQVTTALSNNVQYYWRVSATNAGGTSVWSDPFSFTTTP